MAQTLPATPDHPHVALDAAGVPFLAGTTMKVVELVMAQQAYGWSPEELHFQHPDIPLSHIYSALAYYWDHREALDRDIERRSERVEQIRRELGPSDLAAKVRALWLDEAERRDREMEEGHVRGVPGNEVLARLRARYA
jgi:uncharacterized protein (DUF433 family)